jgi:hypothetical protein
MSNQITICLSSSQWQELEKHLPLEACPKRVGLPEFTMIQEDDCRPLLDEAQYEALIGIARTHCSDLVPLMSLNGRMEKLNRPTLYTLSEGLSLAAAPEQLNAHKIQQ